MSTAFISMRPILLAGGLLALAACETTGFDLDVRDTLGGDFSTTGSGATAPKPTPDANGVITYPDYQVAVAREGDTAATVAARLGQDPQALARTNGLRADATLRGGEVLVLTSPATGQTDIAALASDAIERSALPEPTGATPSAPLSDAPQPVRHKVGRGETAYSIARVYGVSPRALADWNGLGPDLAVREDQYLLIPVAVATEPEPPAPAPTTPGQGSPTPVPPSATAPLPEPEPVANAPESPELDQFRTEASDTSAFVYPVNGRIIRSYRKGSNDGIGIAADAGSPVQAADAGQVAAITQDTDQVPILVLRHDNNLLTVYANVSDITVAKGARVSRGQRIASVAPGDPSFLHFEIRDGVESVDPLPYLE